MRIAELVVVVGLAGACSSSTTRPPAPAEVAEAGMTAPRVAPPGVSPTVSTTATPTGAPPTGVTAPRDALTKKVSPMNLDDLLLRAGSATFASYDPSAVVAAVNALVPLGKDGALAAIEAFLAKQDLAKAPQQGLFLVLRVLFEADAHPPMRLGGSQPAPPPAPAALPRFPIALVDDVPLMLVQSYTLRGLPEPVSAHVAYYRAHGTLRAGPLAPAANPDPMAGYESAYRAAYGAAPSAGERAFIQTQLAKR